MAFEGDNIPRAATFFLACPECELAPVAGHLHIYEVTDMELPRPLSAEELASLIPHLQKYLATCTVDQLDGFMVFNMVQSIVIENKWGERRLQLAPEDWERHVFAERSRHPLH